MSDEMIEVPVTRPARVRLLGRAVFGYGSNRWFCFDGVDIGAMLSRGSRIAVRPSNVAGESFRCGTARIDHVMYGFAVPESGTIPAFCDGDYVYLVEDA